MFMDSKSGWIYSIHFCLFKISSCFLIFPRKTCSNPALVTLIFVFREQQKISFGSFLYSDFMLLLLIFGHKKNFKSVLVGAYPTPQGRLSESFQN